MTKSRRTPEEGSGDRSERASEQQRHEQLLKALGQLRSVVEEQLAAIHDRVEHFAEVVREAVEEIGVLRDAIDEEREAIEWASHNGKPYFQLTSFPIDPSAKDWAVRLNSLTPASLPPHATTEPLAESDRPPPTPLHETSSAQKKLWS